MGSRYSIQKGHVRKGPKPVVFQKIRLLEMLLRRLARKTSSLHGAKIQHELSPVEAASNLMAAHTVSDQPVVLAAI